MLLLLFSGYRLTGLIQKKFTTYLELILILSSLPLHRLYGRLICKLRLWARMSSRCLCDVSSALAVQAGYEKLGIAICFL